MTEVSTAARRLWQPGNDHGCEGHDSRSRKNDAKETAATTTETAVTASLKCISLRGKGEAGEGVETARGQGARAERRRAHARAAGTPDAGPDSGVEENERGQYLAPGQGPASAQKQERDNSEKKSATPCLQRVRGAVMRMKLRGRRMRRRCGHWAARQARGRRTPLALI